MGYLQFIFIIIILISILYKVSFWLTNKIGINKEKISIYENGFEPIGDSQMKIDIIYWIIGLLYLIFDLEIIFIIPFISIKYMFHSFLTYLILKLFLILLILGFIYELVEDSLNILPTIIV